MSATTIEAARIAGAKKCVDALRQLEQAAEADHPSDNTVSGYYARRHSDACAFVAALGPMTPEQEGHVAVLAEYIHTFITTGQPNLAPRGWAPLSAKTASARRAMYKKLEAEYAAENAAFEQARKAARKVVSMADWMTAQ